MKVTIKRTANRYRRSVNGAWRGDAPEVTVHPGVNLEDVPRWTIGDSNLEVEFPDGTVEHILAGRQPFPGYPPTVLGDRLAAAYAAAGVDFNRF
jgi:hypothetical protein